MHLVSRLVQALGRARFPLDPVEPGALVDTTTCSEAKQGTQKEGEGGYKRASGHQCSRALNQYSSSSATHRNSTNPILPSFMLALGPRVDMGIMNWKETRPCASVRIEVLIETESAWRVRRI